MKRADAIKRAHGAPTGVEAKVLDPNVPPRTHKDRVRASMEWALEEHAATLAKLAK